MPIRKNILRKGKAPKQNLQQFDVLQEETGVLGNLITSRFFKISGFPSELPTGNSSFLIEGSDLLKSNIELKTEILDAGGNPIFHYAVPGYEKELPSRRIAIEVYQDDSVSGIGTFTALGELDPNKFDIPSEFQDTYNVRFTAPISINKSIKNTQPIRFYGDPTITVSELVKGVIEYEEVDVTITGSVEVNTITHTFEQSPTDSDYIPDVSSFDEIGGSQQAYAATQQDSAQSSIFDTNKSPDGEISLELDTNFVVKELESSVFNDVDKLSSVMKGATISFTNPHLQAKDGNNQQLSSVKYEIPTTFESKIISMENAQTFRTTKAYVVTRKSTNQKQTAGIFATPNNATITFTAKRTEAEDAVFKRSYANITVGNLQTFSGDTYKAKIYMKEDGSSGGFEQIYETLVEAPNELVDLNSISGFKNVGSFTTQSIVDNYWVTSSNLSLATQNDNTLMGGVLLSSSFDDRFTFVTQQTYSLQKNEPYVVEFKTAVKSNSNLAKLEVFLTGSFISTQDQELILGEVDLSSIKLSSDKFIVLPKLQISDFKTHNGNSSPSGSLGFRVSYGQFIISDVRLRPFSETNFSPGFFKANVPMPKPIKRGKKYDFLVEFYDANNNKADTVAIADDVTFQGPPQVIADGLDATFSGSMVIGESMEMYGVNPAYLRTTGYRGFQHSLDNNLGGFLIFSGSIDSRLTASEQSGFEYNGGVGLEVVDGGSAVDRYLRFRTQPSIFEVKTDTFFFGRDGQFISGSGGTIAISSSNFFLGDSNGAYISGSSGNLEISSDNFSVDVNGNVTMSGFVSASGGHIGNFRLVDGKISGSNITMDANNSTIYKTDQGPGSDPQSPGFESQANEYYIDFTPTEETPNNYYIKMGPNFMVDKDGILIASGATFVGTITASAGLIGGFTVGSASLFNGSESTPNFFFSGSATGTNFNKGNLFISSSGFQVNSQGAMSASSGQIGGWDLTTTELQGTNAVLKSSGVLSLGSGTDNYNQANRIYIDGSTSNGRMSIGTGFRYASNTLTIDGSATIGGFSIATTGLTSTGVGMFPTGQTYAFTAGTGGTPPFSVTHAGALSSTSGQIGGWTIGTNKISSNNLILHSDGYIETTNYKSDVKGFKLGTNVLSDGSVGSFLEVDEAKIRGTLKTTVFEKETVNAVGGQLQISNATTITGSVAVGASDTIIQVANASGFTAGEIILAKKFNSTGFTTEYMEVQSVAREDAASDTNFSGSLTVLRGRGQSPASGTISGSLGGTGQTGQTYSPGQVLVSTGKVGTGYIRLNANPNDQATPFIDIVERSGSGVYDVDLKTRLGDLSGISSALVGSNPGFGLYTEKLFLRADNAESASIAVGSATDATTGNGLYMDGSGVFRVGNPSGNQVYWNGSTLAITGDITVSNTEDFVFPNETGSFTQNSATSSLENPSNYSFGGDATFPLNALPGSITTAGLYLGSNNLGYHDGSVYKTYMDSSGNFYLGGTSGALQWSSGTLTITGNISFTNSPNISTFTNDSGFTDDTVANSKPSVFRQTSQPSTSSPVGSLWYDTDDDNKLYVLVSGTPNVWTPTQDGDIATAQSAADAAQATADSRPKVFRQTSAPSTSEPGGSLWYDTDDDNKLYILVSSTWTPTRDGQITTALADAAAAQSTANTANTTATAVSNDLQDVIDGVSVSGAGTFIDANVIYSPLIAGTNGYISNVFKVGNAGITLDGVNKKIYIGTGTYNNSNTAFYVDNSNNFSLGNKLSWNGSSLSVTGTINATAGNFTSTVSVGSGATTGTVAVGTATNKINIIGTNADSTTKIAASNGAFEMRADGTATFANGEITFASNGNITSQTFLLEKTRLFGAGGDGAIVLKSGDCTVTDTGDGAGTKVSNASIQDARGDTVCTRSGTTWTMKGDWYTTSLEIDNSTGATTLITNGYRLFVKGTLTIDSSCIVHNDGSDGTTGGNSTNTDTSGGSSTPTAGGAGGGEAGCSLGGGPDGKPGSRGGRSGASIVGSGADTYYGAHGGGGGGGGGIVFISCREIVNNGTIRSNGGNGGDGGDGGLGGDPGGNGTDGGNGSVVHVII